MSLRPSAAGIAPASLRRARCSERAPSAFNVVCTVILPLEDSASAAQALADSFSHRWVIAGDEVLPFWCRWLPPAKEPPALAPVAQIPDVAFALAVGIGGRERGLVGAACEEPAHRRSQLRPVHVGDAGHALAPEVVDRGAKVGGHDSAAGRKGALDAEEHLADDLGGQPGEHDATLAIAPTRQRVVKERLELRAPRLAPRLIVGLAEAVHLPRHQAAAGDDRAGPERRSR